MKAVTEFPSFVLSRALTTRNELVAQGKTAEEVQAALGESFKYEGDKLKHFTVAIDLAEKNAANLKRVLVITLNEGESAPAKAVKVEESYYIPESLVTRSEAPAADPKAGRFGKGGKGKGGPKSSPWGLSPEEKAAKNKPAAKPTT